MHKENSLFIISCLNLEAQQSKILQYVTVLLFLACIMRSRQKSILYVSFLICSIFYKWFEFEVLYIYSNYKVDAVFCRALTCISHCSFKCHYLDRPDFDQTCAISSVLDAWIVQPLSHVQLSLVYLFYVILYISEFQISGLHFINCCHIFLPLIFGLSSCNLLLETPSVT